jgi:hypothetical protein
MPITIDILDFLRTGQFGPVRFGISRSELHELLGEPDDLGVGTMRRRDRHPTIFKYGTFEFYVHPEQDRLYAIHCDHFDMPRGNEQLQLHLHGIDGSVTIARAQDLLESAAIQFSERNDEIQGTRLVTEGGVTLGFDDYEPDASVRKLVVISRFNPSVLAQEEPFKQVAIRIPEDAYELLREQAQAKKIAIAKLCSQWVVEKLNGESQKP